MSVIVTISDDAAAQMGDRRLRDCVRHIARSFGRAGLLARFVAERKQ